ncbi:MAG: putative N-acyltransferase [Sphingobacteriales bacterium]|jgi:predicted N-acyltransferase
MHYLQLVDSTEEICNRISIKIKSHSVTEWLFLCQKNWAQKKSRFVRSGFVILRFYSPKKG